MPVTYPVATRLRQPFYLSLLGLSLVALVLLYWSRSVDPYDVYVAPWFPVGVSFMAVSELLDRHRPTWALFCQQAAWGCVLFFVLGLCRVLLGLY